MCLCYQAVWLGTSVSWVGNHRSGVSLTIHHRRIRIGLSTYGLNDQRHGDEHPTCVPSETRHLYLCFLNGTNNCYMADHTQACRVTVHCLSLSRGYSSSSRKYAMKCTGVTRLGDCVVNWLLYAWCVVQVWLRHRHGARQEPIGWLRTSCLPTADCLPSSQVYDRWRIHCISCRHSPVKYHSVVYHVDLPRWLRWLRHSVHRPGRSIGGATGFNSWVRR